MDIAEQDRPADRDYDDAGMAGPVIESGPTMNAEQAAHELVSPGRSIEDVRAMVAEYLDDVSGQVGVAVHQWGLDDADLAEIRDSYQWVAPFETLTEAREHAARDAAHWAASAAAGTEILARDGTEPDPGLVAATELARDRAAQWAARSTPRPRYAHTEDESQAAPDAADNGRGPATTEPPDTSGQVSGGPSEVERVEQLARWHANDQATDDRVICGLRTDLRQVDPG